MSRGDRNLIRLDKKSFPGGRKNEGGDREGVFIFAGKNDRDPTL